MRPVQTAATLLIFASVWLPAFPTRPQGAAPQKRDAPAGFTRVYGFELESDDERDRVLVFGEKPLTYHVSEPDATTVAVDLPRTVLDRSAARRLEGSPGGSVIQVRAFERGDTPVPQIRLLIQRTGTGDPRVSRRGSMLAIDFARARSEAQEPIALQFADTEIAEIVRFVSERTGASFVFDEQLQGRITVSIAEPVSPEEALEVLHAALLLKGFAALPSPGGPRKIVRISDVPGGAPWIPAELLGGGEAAVSTLVRLEAADVDEMATVLKPLVGTAGLALPYRPTNSLVLASSERRLERWLRIIRALDQAELQQLVLRKLHYRPAAEAADLLAGLLGEPETQRVPVDLWADERTNVLVVRSSADRIDEVREWLEAIDVPAEGGGAIRTLPVLHADVERLAQTLGALAQGEAAGLPAAAGPLAGRDFQIAAHPPSNALVVRADPETFDVIRDVVRQLDLAPPRIGIEVIVMEFTTSDTLALGFDFVVPLTDPKEPGDLIAVIASTPSGGLIDPALDQPRAGVGRFTRGPLTIPIVNPLGETIEVVVPSDIYVMTADGREVRSRLLMRPQIVTIPGEEHEIFTGNNIPIPVSRTGEGVNLSALNVTQNIERQDVGVRLRVRPFVGEGDTVRLELELEETQVVPSDAGDVQAVGPTLLERRLSATLRLREGEYALLGGIVQPLRETQSFGTPFLKDIPVLGALFRTTAERTLRNELVIAAQAWVQRSASEDAIESVRRRLAFERSLARASELLEETDGPFALLAASYASNEEAREAAARLAAEAGRRTRTTSWSWRDGPQRFDVYVPGFESFSAASAASLELVERGWRPEVVVLRGATGR